MTTKTNETKTEFELSAQDDYLQLSPIGVFPHPRGLQNVDKAALEAIVKNFKSFFSRLGRRFAGLPFYVGHPDVQGYSNSYSDRKAYGWIMDLEAREDGLYGRTKWSAAGRELIRNGHYKFLSPTWSVENIGNNSGQPVYRPTQLISVGLTNEPNLPVLPLANSDSAAEPNTLAGIPIEFGNYSKASERSELNLQAPDGGITADPDSTAEGKMDDLQKTPPGSAPVSDSAALSDLSTSVVNHRIASVEKDNQVLEKRISTLEQSLANCQRELADVQHRLITTILDNAIADIRIFPAERARWHTALQDDFKATYEHLANAKPLLRSKARSDGPAPVPIIGGTFEEREKRMHTLVNERMRATGATYHEAWLQVRSENAALF
jgi:hypothetical protein